MEIVAMATDLAEFLGAAIGFNLLFGIPLWLAGLFTAAATFIILSLEHYGFRPIESVISVLVGVVAVSYLIETVLDKPAWGLVLKHAVLTQFQGTESVLLACGILGATASWVFGISLLAAGLSSASVGTMAGQVIMQGFLHRHIPPWLRRLVTMLPSLIVIAIGLDPTRTLVISQVMLSFGLPFAVIPLVLFTQRRDLMGILVNRRMTTVAASLVA